MSKKKMTTITSLALTIAVAPMLMLGNTAAFANDENVTSNEEVVTTTEDVSTNEEVVTEVDATDNARVESENLQEEPAPITARALKEFPAPKVTVTEVTTTSFKVSWSDPSNSNPTQWAAILYKGDGYDNNFVADKGVNETVSTVFKNLEPGVKYRVEVFFHVYTPQEVIGSSKVAKLNVTTLKNNTGNPGGNNGNGNNNGGGNPPKSVSFTDVPKNHKFYNDITWLATEGITTGVKQSNGSVKFLPKDNVSREAMIAFLYRANGVKNYKPKGKSPFTDVKPGDKFYTQIMWAYETKVTTGTKQPNGTRVFEPKASITREAMAAFMYRQYGKKIKTGATSAKFTDIPANHKFGKEIKWMASNKITTGTKQANGTVVFDPKGATSREATAAFLHRAELKK